MMNLFLKIVNSLKFIIDARLGPNSITKYLNVYSYTFLMGTSLIFIEDYCDFLFKVAICKAELNLGHLGNI